MKIELARDNYLRPNGLGGVIIRQSDLSSFARCQLQKYYYDRAAADPTATQPRSLSATVYGSVVHYALMLLERLHYEGDESALDTAVSTFHHYWHPDNLHVLTGERIDTWLPRQTYAGLKARGEIAITDYYRILRTDVDSQLLGLEYQFAVPIQVGDRTHTLTGTIDKLRLGRYMRKPFVSVDDFKTGKQPTYLRWNMQGTAYSYATTRREFWLGWAESGMGELATFDQDVVDNLEGLFRSWGFRLLDDGTSPAEDASLRLASRKFRWINMQEIKIADGGWRTARDYARLHLAIDGYVRSCETGSYSINQIGEVCVYCPFQHDCGGVGLAPESSGAPS